MYVNDYPESLRNTVIVDKMWLKNRASRFELKAGHCCLGHMLKRWLDEVIKEVKASQVRTFVFIANNFGFDLMSKLSLSCAFGSFSPGYSSILANHFDCFVPIFV